MATEGGGSRFRARCLRPSEDHCHTAGAAAFLKAAGVAKADDGMVGVPQLADLTLANRLRKCLFPP